MPPLFKILEKEKGIQEQGDALVRWRVRLPGELEDRTWKDETLISSWQEFDAVPSEKKWIMYGDGGTSSSWNETSFNDPLQQGQGKTNFLQRYYRLYLPWALHPTPGGQACTVGYEVSQKAHNALRWLIQRQAFRNDDQVILSWEPSGKTVPPIAANSLEAFFEEETGESLADEQTVIGDIGQEYALKLRKKNSRLERPAWRR